MSEVFNEKADQGHYEIMPKKRHLYAVFLTPEGFRASSRSNVLLTYVYFVLVIVCAALMYTSSSDTGSV